MHNFAIDIFFQRPDTGFYCQLANVHRFFRIIIPSCWAWRQSNNHARPLHVTSFLNLFCQVQGFSTADSLKKYIGRFKESLRSKQEVESRIGVASKEKIQTPVGMFNVGDTLKAMVISVSSDDRKIALSTKALEEGDEETVKEEFEQKQQAQGPSTIGDLLKAAADGQGEEDNNND